MSSSIPLLGIEHLKLLVGGGGIMGLMGRRGWRRDGVVRLWDSFVGYGTSSFHQQGNVDL